MPAGQAQKEFFLNQTICLLDALMVRAVISSLDAPPPEAAEGECYRVLDGATGEWGSNDRSIAVKIGGGWHFVSPSLGMQVFDRESRCWFQFDGDWFAAVAPPSAEGGATVDQEARTAIAQLVEALRSVGIFGQN